MTVWIMAAVAFLVALAVVLVPGKMRHSGGRTTGLWFNRRIQINVPGSTDLLYCIAHEDAHAKMYHMEKLLAAYAVGLTAAAVVANLTPWPVAVFLVLGIAANLGTRYLEDYFERQAHERAKKCTWEIQR